LALSTGFLKPQPAQKKSRALYHHEQQTPDNFSQKTRSPLKSPAVEHPAHLLDFL
jgi:hypothetical protein